MSQLPLRGQLIQGAIFRITRILILAGNIPNVPLGPVTKREKPGLNRDKKGQNQRKRGKQYIRGRTETSMVKAGDMQEQNKDNQRPTRKKKRISPVLSLTVLVWFIVFPVLNLLLAYLQIFFFNLK